MIKCKICNKECTSNVSLVKHIKYSHNVTSQEYYDKFIKTKDEGICLTCGKPTKYVSISKGYAKYCGITCLNSWEIRSQKLNNFEKEKSHTREATLINKYGEVCLQNIPITKFNGTYFINNKYLPQIENNYKCCKYKCVICDIAVKSNQALGNHIKSVHKITSNEYYDKYLKVDNNEGKCISCGKPTRFIGIDIGYNKHCSHECNNKDPKFRNRVSETISSDKWQQANKQKMIERYGVDSYSKTNEFKAKFNKTFKDNIKKFEEENNCTLLFKLIEEYGQGWYTQGIGRRIKNGFNIYVLNDDIEQIKKYSSENHQSTFETDIVEYINSVYSGKIILRSRKIIPPLELDIYIPEKKIAIEVNGVHWHSTNAGVPKNYHLNKTKLCEEQGIRLIHIFDIEWLYNKKVIQSLISGALGIYEQKIYARDCDIKEVDSIEAIQFLNKNHIQGSINSSYKLGLFYKDKLVQLITIGKSRFKSGEYELLRMCTKLDTQVVGGFSRLMKHQPHDNLISYIDRSKFSGNSYLQNNWAIIEYTQPSYFYYRRDVGKINRLAAQKHKLPKLLGNDNFDSSKTEVQNMINNNFYQVYDCGNIKVKFIKDK